MREGWELKTISDISTIKGRIGYRGYTKEDIVEPGEGAITLSPSNIIDNKSSYEKCTYISWFKYDESPEIMIFEGDILFVKTGSSYGKTALIEGLREKATINPQLVVLKDIQCLNKFLFYGMTSVDFKEKVESIIGGSSIPTLSQANLSKLQIPVPPLTEQKQIVAILDEAFAAIDQAKANIEKNIQNAKELFDSKKEELFEELALEHTPIPIQKACKKIFAGGDAPKENFSKEKTDELNVPIIANAVKDNGLYGYTNEARVSEPSITVAARGSGTGHTEFRDYPFLPIVRLIVLTPNTEIINVEFLMHAIKNLTIMRSGSAIPQLTVPMIKGYSIPVPQLEKQIQIVGVLNNLYDQLDAYSSRLTQKLKEFKELKKSILQKAFAGELSEAGLSGLEDKQDLKGNINQVIL